MAERVYQTGLKNSRNKELNEVMEVTENSTNELIARIEAKYDKMSKGQKRLADYVCQNYDKAVFLTAARLGEIVGVSESTVVRFATQLGYKGYPGFQKALEELVRNKLNSIQRMEVTYGRISQSEILETVLQSDIEKIKLTLAAIDHKAFNLAIDTILNARKIYVIGIRSCAPLASFLTFYLNLVCEDVTAVNTNSSSEIFEQLIRIGEEDVIIGISFPRYSMRTLKALEFASNRKAKVITLTDSIHSPMNLYSSCNLIARSDMASIVDSLVAPLSVVNALIVAWAAVTYLLWEIAYTGGDIPLWGVTSLMTEDEKARNKLLSMARIFGGIGAGVSLLAMQPAALAIGGFISEPIGVKLAGSEEAWQAIVAESEANTAAFNKGLNENLPYEELEQYLVVNPILSEATRQGERWGFLIAAAAFGLLGAALFQLCGPNIKERVPSSEKRYTLKENVKIMFGNKPSFSFVQKQTASAHSAFGYSRQSQDAYSDRRDAAYKLLFRQ